MIIPEPIKGIVSQSDVNAAMPIGFFMPIIEKPMINSIKVKNISIKYALVYFKTIWIVYIFAWNNKDRLFLGSNFVKNDIMFE